jgi:hypothetical protein
MKSYSKYKNVKTIVDGIKFDSKKEGARYSELKMLEKAGFISDLELQPKFMICKQVKWGGKTLRKRYYIADFYYVNQENEQVVEDVKGCLTDIYKLKKQIFLTLYPHYIFIET